jgi:8-oxo-dGTP pyrophosphatase MutT (NUDIX family)
MTTINTNTYADADADDRTREAEIEADVAIAFGPVLSATTELKADEDRIERTSAIEHVKGRVVGASLLCFCVDPRWGRLYFLLGKERKNTRWPGGSERWSGFGGRTANKNERPEETAAREFMEESMAVVKYFDNDVLPRTGYADIAESLRKKDFTFQFTLGMGTGTRPWSYVTYVKQVPWDPTVIRRFADCRDMLMNASTHYDTDAWRAALTNHPGVRKIVADDGGTSVQVMADFVEKKSIGLWSVPQLRHAVDYNGIMSSRNGHVERCRPAFSNFLTLLLSEINFYEPESAYESVM